MPIILNDDVVFVSGYKNGAIYDFNKNEIFSLNEESKNCLLHFLECKRVETFEEKEFIGLLEKFGLLNANREYLTYLPNVDYRCNINFVWLEITQSCNLKCIHCYEGVNHKSLESLSVEKWKSVIKELFELGCKNIQFIGGEPSCYKNIIELIDYAGKFSFNSICFFTNATLITDELLECFLRNNVRVNVSIYGHNPEIHERITGIKGSFAKTIGNIKKLVRAKIKVKIAVTIMHENENYFENIVDFIKYLGVKYYKFDLVREVSSSCFNNCHLATRDDLIKLKCKTAPSFAINKRSFDKAFIQNTCWYGKFVITENGDVLPCVFERNIKYGNIKKDSISSILQSEVLKKHWFLDFSKVEECGACEYKYACKDCRYLGIINGGIYKKSLRCFYNPIMGTWRK